MPSSSAAAAAVKRRAAPTSSRSKDSKIPIRRSKSVSAASRANGPLPFSSSPSKTDEFLNKRDNPLYSCSSSSPSPSSSPPKSDLLDDESGRRGRSACRSSDGGGGSSTGSTRSGNSGRSLSRADAGSRRRLRSVSREHYGSSFGSDRGQIGGGHSCNYTSSLGSKGDRRSSTTKGQKRCATVKVDAKENTMNLQTWTSRHPILKSWDASSSCAQARNWEDETSTSSFSEAEEPTLVARDYSFSDVDSCKIYGSVQSEVRLAVSEICDDLGNVFPRKNPAKITTENIEIIRPEFVISDGFVSDVRNEYASKLEQSQERARKLRADLAVEEQREQELRRILVEIQTSRNTDSHKSKPRRKASIERLRMSRRLAEEAMNYFDECVSISTFDSSDFSSLEDPKPNSELDNQTQCSLSIGGSDVAIKSSCSGGNTPRSGGFLFSPRHSTMKAIGVHDVDQYIKTFDKESNNGSVNKADMSSSYRSEDYDLSAKSENLAFESLILRSRIESGGLLLCNIRSF